MINHLPKYEEKRMVKRVCSLLILRSVSPLLYNIRNANQIRFTVCVQVWVFYLNIRKGK